MKKALIILALAVAIQVALSAPHIHTIDETQGVSEEDALKQTKRFKLYEFAYDSFRKTVWPDEIFPMITEYMNIMKEWSDNNEALKHSNIYTELVVEIDNCLSLLKELAAEPGNCERQWALREIHLKIRALIDRANNDNVKLRWVSKFIKVSSRIYNVVKKSYENLYTLLVAKVDSYLNDEAGNEEARTSIVQWQKKLTQDSRFEKKQMLVKEFMRLFPEERAVLETQCKLQFTNSFELRRE